ALRRRDLAVTDRRVHVVLHRGHDGRPQRVAADALALGKFRQALAVAQRIAKLFRRRLERRGRSLHRVADPVTQAAGANATSRAAGATGRLLAALQRVALGLGQLVCRHGRVDQLVAGSLFGRLQLVDGDAQLLRQDRVVLVHDALEGVTQTAGALLTGSTRRAARALRRLLTALQCVALGLG